MISPRPYGSLPVILSTVCLHPTEVLYYLYLPISLRGCNDVRLPQNLRFIWPVVERVMNDEPQRFRDEYVYATVKRMFVGGGVTANRPGWHADGFLSTDLNYIWYDELPTIFNASKFNITPDHAVSLEEFARQALPENDLVYPPGMLLKLDQSVVHRVGDAGPQIMRTFVKISISPDRYNLQDNSRNYDLDYNWPMHERSAVRNNPAIAQTEAVKETPPDDHFA